MPVEVVFETHALSEDNERGIATGWLPGHLCALGRDNAAQVTLEALVAAGFSWREEGWEYLLG
jgi:hypothetical protein